ncbi:MAG: ATP-binding cassette domain-containing protein, partial [Candidatus Cloacimonadota bacterium]|nr:ATP-binding cassette domain-containing protein [Candidatus Cloacimonadota bacterium]
KDIFEATKIAAVHEVIQDFNEGYDTVVGEKGVTLSGGQKQRVSIARTILKKSPIVIFDDSLSAVDTQTDAKIRTELSKKTEKVTTIIISHRLSSFVDADKILVLKDGKIIEAGNHRELLLKKGFYQRIWQAQNSI